MARILCNVAGGGKPLKGNAGPGDVLAGKTFSNKQSNALTGSMPNNGAWSASTSGNGSVTIPAGYHNGSGTVSGAASYNKGVSDADARVNTSSASYNSGYAKGYTDGQHNPIIKTIQITAHASGKWVPVRGSTTVSSMSKILAVGIPSVGYGSLQNLSCSYSGNVVSLYFETQDAYGDGANFTFYVVVVGY